MKVLRNFAIGVALASALATVALDLPKRTVNGKEYYFYEVPAKETIYSITRKFGVTRDEIVRYNPQVVDGLRAGDVLYFPVVQQPDSVAVVDEEVAEVVAVDSVIAMEDSVAVTSAPDSIEGGNVHVEDVVVAEVVAEEVDSNDVEQLTVAVMLPFMLESENMTRQVENHTNFYRGMLMAIDSIGSPSLKINLMAYDTEGSPARVEQLMSMPELRGADFIIAPPDSLGIERIANVADSLNACVVNLFAVKNDAHIRHESVLQSNVPHDDMYCVAINAFCERFRGRKVIILNATDIPAEKAEFVEELSVELVRNGLPYETVNYAGKLSDEDLSALQTGRDYVFIPTCHSREALMKILPTLNDFKEANPTVGMTLFGYPEWVLLRGDIKDRLHRLNTTVYSRFSTDIQGADFDRIKRAYAKWFGSQMPQSIPNTTLLGFDTMAWLIFASQQGVTEPYTGLQNAFRVRELDGAGDVNTALYLINFQPSGRLNATVL